MTKTTKAFCTALSAFSIVSCSTGRPTITQSGGSSGAAGLNGAAGAIGSGGLTGSSGSGGIPAGGGSSGTGGKPGSGGASTGGPGGALGSGGGSGGSNPDGGPVDMAGPPDATVDTMTGSDAPVDLGPAPDLGPPPPFQPLAAGEHPRLFFRSYDLPALQAKAATSQGMAMIAQLKAALGGGEALRTDMSGFTLWDGFGFGILYQLTGAQKYADACQQATQLVLNGTADVNKEYNWPAPSGYMDTTGGTMTSVAMAYDVCYGGWSDSFRTMVAQKMMAYQCPNQMIEGWPTSGATVTLEQMAVTPPGDPGTWTFGPVVAGAGLITLATMGDPGVDATESAKLLTGVETNIERVFTEGWGDMGAFYRMAKQGAIVTNTGFVPLVQAMRVALNKDYVADHPGAEWMTMHWVFDLVADPMSAVPRFPDRHDASALVNTFNQVGIRYGGTFEEGLGAVSAAMKPAILWTNQTLGLGSQQDGVYPQHLALAFVNTPVDVAAQNPGDVMPHILQDHSFGLYEFRKSWKDKNDILVTALLGGWPDESPNASVTVWGFGFRTTFGSMPLDEDRPRPKNETFVASKDGSGILSTSGSSLAVDFSGASGADALLAFVGSRADSTVDMDRHDDFGARAATTMVMLGSTPVYVMTLQAGTAPAVTVAGSKISVGNQTISWSGTALSFGTMNP
jgi:hypothetical protein